MGCGARGLRNDGNAIHREGEGYGKRVTRIVSH